MNIKVFQEKRRGWINYTCKNYCRDNNSQVSCSCIKKGISGVFSNVGKYCMHDISSIEILDISMMFVTRRNQYFYRRLTSDLLCHLEVGVLISRFVLRIGYVRLWNTPTNGRRCAIVKGKPAWSGHFEKVHVKHP